MLLSRIHLRKVLQLFALSDRARTAEVRADIRNTLAAERGVRSSGGGDFHAPFWTDAKNHVAGTRDLRDSIQSRVESNERRRRLYPALAEGFLDWWEERRRWNEPFEFYEQSVKARYLPRGLGAEIKVENLLALRVGDASRLYYPYFCEDPVLPAEIARLGLWLMSQALPDSELEDLRILDVLRGRSFAVGDAPPRGDEEREFVGRYQQLIEDWHRLRPEYD